MRIAAADNASSQSVSALLRFGAYAFSCLVGLYLGLFCSPYKLHYGPMGSHYYDDDGIAFGIMISVLLLLLHGAGAVGKGILHKKKPSLLAWVFLAFYSSMVCYWLYHANSTGAMHEY
jgi:hypothetical protein